MLLLDAEFVVLVSFLADPHYSTKSDNTNDSQDPYYNSSNSTGPGPPSRFVGVGATNVVGGESLCPIDLKRSIVITDLQSYPIVTLHFFFYCF